MFDVRFSPTQIQFMQLQIKLSSKKQITVNCDSEIFLGMVCN